MAQTKFSIASQALIQLRAATVSSFEDGTNEADIMADMYDTWARMVLAIHPWSFARRREQLIRENKTQPGWAYLYKVPATALRIFAIYNSPANNAPPFKNFEIVSDDAGQYVACNEETVFALFTTYVPEAVWPAWFVDFAIYALAAHVGMPVTHDETLTGLHRQTAYGPPSDNGNGGKFAIAASVSDQQSPPQNYRENEIIQARFS